MDDVPGHWQHNLPRLGLEHIQGNKMSYLIQNPSLRSPDEQKILQLVIFYFVEPYQVLFNVLPDHHCPHIQIQFMTYFSGDVLKRKPSNLN